MSAELVFMMGNFEARFPTDRLYAKNHMWALACGELGDETRFRFGLTAYAVRLLQDVYFLDLTIEAGMHLGSKQEIGSIESKKAESSLYTPASGTVTSVNSGLIDDPTAINLDKYGAGWMFELATAGREFLQPQAYIDHLQAAWEVAQRTIKGQVNA
ncbi:MAG: glycine cleavage system protein H [Aureliella sp.]